jgi:hypothetical protein
MACSKFEKDRRDTKELEELIYLTFHESTRTREVEDTIFGDISGSYTQPLMIQKDLSGHPPYPTSSKQFFGQLTIFSNYSVLELPGPF